MYASKYHINTLKEAPAEAEIKTINLDELQALPEPFRKVAMAVYKFEDLTGQNKPEPTR